MFREKAFSSYSVDDVDKAKEFYGKTLGIEVSDNMDGLALNFDSGAKVFLYPKDDHTPATFTVLNLPVDNIKEAYDELDQRGVRFGYQNDPELETDEKGIYWGLEKGEGPNIAWFRDPAGNILSVIEDRKD